MTHLSSFTYKYGNSLLHRLDIRFKLLCLIFVSIALLHLHFKALALLGLGILLLIIRCRLSLLSVFKELRYFFILLLFVWIARSISTPGTPFFPIEIPITQEGVYDGLLVCWRLLLIALLGLILTATSRSSEIRAAVAWFFKPIPFVPHKRVAVMISLMIRFIPVILNQAGEISDIQQARGIENRKNPIYRLIKFSIPLLRRIFKQADNLVMAMEARCYSEERTESVLVSSKKDWSVLFGVMGGIFLLMLL